MATLLYSSSYGSDDPTRATFPFIMANGAIDAGHAAQIFLHGEAVYLMKQEVADAVQPVGWPALKDQMVKAIGGGATLHI